MASSVLGGDEHAVDDPEGFVGLDLTELDADLQFGQQRGLGAPRILLERGDHGVVPLGERRAGLVELPVESLDVEAVGSSKAGLTQALRPHWLAR